MKKIIAVLFLIGGFACAKDLDAEISETKTYTKLELDHVDKYNGVDMTVTAKMTATDGNTKRVTCEILQADLVSKLVENTSVKQSDVEEVLEWLKPTIEQLVEEAQ